MTSQDRQFVEDKPSLISLGCIILAKVKYLSKKNEHFPYTESELGELYITSHEYEELQNVVVKIENYAIALIKNFSKKSQVVSLLKFEKLAKHFI
jgi:hypothetical protein